MRCAFVVHRFFCVVVVLVGVLPGGIKSASADTTELQGIDLATATFLAETVANAENTTKQARELLAKSPNEIVAELAAQPEVRLAVAEYVESFAVPILQRAQKSQELNALLALGTDVQSKIQDLRNMAEKLKVAEYQAQATLAEVQATIDTVKNYQKLLSFKDPLALAKNKIARAINEPIQVTVSGKTVTITVVGGEDTLFDSPASLKLRVEYAGGLAVIASDVEVDFATGEFKVKPDKIEMDQSSISGAASVVITELLKKSSLPIPITLGEPPKLSGAGLPELTFTVSTEIPGLEFLTDLLKSLDASIAADITIKPGPLDPSSAPKLISVTKVELKSKSAIPPLVLGTTGLELTLEKLGLGADQKVSLNGNILPAGTTATTSPVRFEYTAVLDPTKRPSVVLEGIVFVKDFAVGDFTAELSGEQFAGTVNFPSQNPKASSPPLVEKLYSGNFSFKVNKEGLSAQGFGQLVQVVKLHFDLFLSFKPKVDSFLKASEELTLDGISGKVELEGLLSKEMTQLHLAASIWAEVDLGIYKPTARIDISADSNVELSKVLLVNPPPAAFTYHVSAAALGVKVSFTVDSLDQLSLEDIQERLLAQLGDMLQRISAAAAEWEDEKRGLLSRWERHWSDTISNEAKKVGLDKVSTGNAEVDEFLGGLSEDAKHAGGVISTFTKGMGGAAADVRGALEEGAKKLDPTTWHVSISQPSDGIVAFAASDYSSCDLSGDALKKTNELLVQLRKLRNEGKLKKPADVAEALKSSIRSGQIARASTDLRTILGTAYGNKLAKALEGTDPGEATDAEIQTALLTLEQLPYYVEGLEHETVVIPSDVEETKKVFQAFADKLDRSYVVRVRREKLTNRQVLVGFEDTFVDVEDLNTITVVSIARVVGSVIESKADSGETTLRAATNLIPIKIFFRPSNFTPSGYTAAFEVPKSTELTAQQLKWIMENKKALEVAGKEQAEKNPSEGGDGFKGIAATFDFSIDFAALPDDENAARKVLEQALVEVFGMNKDAKAALDVDTIIRNALQAPVESALPGVEVLGVKALSERNLAFANHTGKPAKVRLKIRQRYVVDGNFQWRWIPSPPGDARFLEYLVGAAANGDSPLRDDTGAEPSDFGDDTPFLLGSRIQLLVENQSGETWDFVGEDTFLVETQPQLGGERVYEANSADIFVFHIQSRIAPPVAAVGLDSSGSAILEHVGDVTGEFDLPLGAGDIHSVLSTLRVQATTRPGVGPKEDLNAEWDWEATIHKSALRNAAAAAGDDTPTDSRRIRIRLNVGSPIVNRAPGAQAPTFPVSVRYSHDIAPWAAAYQLHLDRTDPARHFVSALRGFYALENTTGMDWENVDTKLTDAGAQASSVSLPHLSVPREHARLLLQSKLPLKVGAAPLLVYDVSVDAKHPVAHIRLTNNDGKEISGGGVAVIDGGLDKGILPIATLKPRQSVVLSYPNALEQRVCIHDQGVAHNRFYRGIFVRNCCLDFHVTGRTHRFEANFAHEYATDRAVGLVVRLPEEECWAAVEQEVSLGGNAPLQSFEVHQQPRKHLTAQSVNLCTSPLDRLRELADGFEDDFRELIAQVIILREQGRTLELKQLLKLSDLGIDDAYVVCDPLSRGMVIEVVVHVRNRGSSPAAFALNETVLTVDGFEPLLATRAFAIAPCESVVFRATRAAAARSPQEELAISIDPTNRVAEWSESNNKLVKTVPVAP